MNYSKTAAVTKRLLITLALAVASVGGLRVQAEAATCFTCHAPVGTSTDIRPVESTYRNITTGSIIGSHAKHIPAATTLVSTCTPCHGAAVSSYTTKHRNGAIDVPGVGYSKTASFSQSGNPTIPLGTCNAASCHDNGKNVLVQSPAWGATAVPACTACHALIPGDSHTKHVTSTQYKTATCASCHTGYVQGTTAAANHLNTTIEVNTGGYPSPKAKGSAFASCATSYCHSSGQSANGASATPVYATTAPTWGGAVACGSCHATSTMSTGSHTKHLTGISPNTNCGNCHTGATLAAYNATTHVDGSINVAAGFTYANLGAPGNGYSACSATSCHDNGKGVSVASPTWGAAAVPACTACHALIPGDSHTKHVTSTLYKTATCASCHTGYVQGTTAAANHLNTTIEVSTGGYPSLKAKGSAFASCATSYCHSSGQSANGASATPVYATTAPTWGGAVACGSCHATSTMSTGSHTKHLTGISPNTNCGNCHTGATLAAYNATTHVDGSINVAAGFTYANQGAPGNGYSACSATSCHDNGKGVSVASPAWGAAAVPACTACHALIPGDSHTKHVTSTLYKTATCASCHTGYVQGTTAAANHLNATIEVNTGGYTSPKAKGSAFASCATSYCHSSGQSTNGLSATPVYGTAPTWGGTVACGSCHATSTMSSGTHTKHLVSSTNCGNCHTGSTLAAYNATTHVDGSINVGVGSYTAAGAPGNGYGKCSTVYCHSAGQGSTGGALVLANYSSATWGGAARNCGGCHKNMASDAAATGNHVRHAQTAAIACAVCHNGYTATTTNAATHANSSINLSFSGNGSTTVYSQGATHAPANGYGKCSTVYCHSAGQSATGGALVLANYSSATWGGVARNCGGCHKNMDTDAAAPGSHVQHAQGTNNIACAACHNGYTETTTAAATHVNASINLSFNATAGVGTVYSKGNTHAPASGYGSCSTSTCHGTSASPVWGTNTAAATCTKCHGKPTLTNYSTANAWQAAPGYAQTAGSGTYTNNVSNTAPYGAHDAHVRAVNAYTTNDVQCANCHGALPTSGSHANGTVNVAWSNLAQNIGTSGTPSTRGTLTPSYTTGTCSANYCHGGKLAGGANTTPTWTGTNYLTAYAKTAANCGQCHGAPPTAAPAAFLHGGIAIANDCSGCHGHNGNGAGHINGTLEAAGGACNSCHSYDTADWATATHNFGGTVASEGIGAHAKHIAYLKTRYGVTLTPASDSFGTGAMASVCGVCHTVNSANHTMSDSTQPRSINFGDGSTAHQFGPSAPLYNGLYNTSSAANNKTCSNLDCHYSTTPLWSTY